jgi:hypothetical protein
MTKKISVYFCTIMAIDYGHDANADDNDAYDKVTELKSVYGKSKLCDSRRWGWGEGGMGKERVTQQFHSSVIQPLSVFEQQSKPDV